ncbi:MAG TPA: zinc ribbon domain-containing protein [Thermoanaerobaculia bacterium]|nr:zinc ribbon domain-containing protein [Thermoanaerobaculia bacterium]
MSDPERIVCVACSHEIDAAAKLCPYCGADPRSGAKADTEAILREMFPQRHAGKSESMIDYARQRQGVVAVIGALVMVLVLAALHEFVTRRNEHAVNAAAAVPLTDVTDLNNQADETKPQPMPDLKFQYDGHPQTMRTLIVEPGAVAPTATQ